MSNKWVRWVFLIISSKPRVLLKELTKVTVYWVPVAAWSDMAKVCNVSITAAETSASCEANKISQLMIPKVAK